MPAANAMAAKLATHIARFATAATGASAGAAAAYQSYTAQGLRAALNNATAASAASSPSVSTASVGAAPAGGAGIAGAKFHAGRGAHSTFQSSGRALTNVPMTGTCDGGASLSEDDEDARRVAATGQTALSPLASSRRSLQRPPSSPRHILASNPGGAGLSAGRGWAQRRTTGLRSLPIILASEADRAVATSARTFSLHTRQEAAQAGVEDGAVTPGGEGAAGSEATSGSQDGGVLRLLEAFTEASDKGDDRAARKLVDSHQHLPKSSRSTQTYNAAMETMLKASAHRTGAEAVSIVTKTVQELYDSMLDNDCAPDGASYSALVQALCRKDIAALSDATILPKASDTSETKEDTDQGVQQPVSTDAQAEDKDVFFRQALAVLDTASTASPDQVFSDIAPFNALLRSCAVRGNSARASEILELASRSKVAPDSDTFRHLLECFGRDATLREGESEADARARNLAALDEVVAQFHAQIPQAERKVAVYNNLIEARFRLGDAAGAVRAVEQMLGPAGEEGAAQDQQDKAAISPDGNTSGALLNGFLGQGDVASVTAWLDRIVPQSEASDAVSPLPLPTPRTLISAVRAIGDTIPLPQKMETPGPDDAMAGSEAQQLLPAMRVANRALSAVYDLAGQHVFRVHHSILNLVIGRNLFLADALLASSPEAADALLDVSLAHLQRHYVIFGDEGLWGTRKPSPSVVRHQLNNLRAIAALVTRLVLRGRLADAGSAFTYAAYAIPAQAGAPRVGPKDGPGSPPDFRRAMPARAASELHSVAKRILAAQPAEVALAAAFEYVMPALLDVRLVPTRITLQAAQLWRSVRLREQNPLDLKALDLSPRALEVLLSTLMREETTRDVDREALYRDGVGLFANDVAKLAPERRPPIGRNTVKILLERYGDDAFPIIEQMDASAAEALREKQWFSSSPDVQERGSPASDAATGTDVYKSTASTAATPPLSPIYQSKRLEPPPIEDHITLPPPYLERPSKARRAVDVVARLPEIAVIDTDLGAALDRALSARRSKPNLSKQALLVARSVFKQMMEPIRTGTYPSPEPINKLLNDYGRHKELYHVHELHSIGTRIVTALGGEPEWQRRAFRELEDATICALAHAGDADSASVHRHRLITAGMVPSASAYGALISAINDTTDEALVAQELFDESQRLGVMPTVYLYNTIISKLSRARKADRALQLFEEMVSLPGLNLRPSGVTYGAVINACVRVGDDVNALRLLQRMEKDAHVQVSVPPLNTIMQYYVYTKPDRARALEMCEKIALHGLEPSAHTYRLLLDAYGTLEPIVLDEVQRVFDEVCSRGLVQGVHWASLITAHGVHAGDVERAQQIFDSIAQHETTVSRPAEAAAEAPLPDAVCLEALLKVFVEQKRLDLLEAATEKLMRSDEPALLTAYVANVLIRGFSRLGGDEGLVRARDIFEQMRDPPAGLAASGNHPEAGHRHVRGNNNVAAAAAAAAAAAKRSARDVRFARLEREPSTYEEAIRAEATNGQLEHAHKLLARMASRAFPPALLMRASSIVAEAEKAGA